MKHSGASNNKISFPPLGLKRQRERVVPGPGEIDNYGRRPPNRKCGISAIRYDIAITKLQPSREGAQGIKIVLLSFSYPLVSCSSVTKSVQGFTTPHTAACQSSLSFSISQNLLKLCTNHELVRPSNHFVLSHLLLFLPLAFPSIRVFSSLLFLQCLSSPSHWLNLTRSQSDGNLVETIHRDNPLGHSTGQKIMMWSKEANRKWNRFLSL